MPVAVPVGGLAPCDRVVVAVAQVGEQVRVEGVRPAAIAAWTAAVGLAQDLADLFGPVLPVGVQFVHALEVADSVLAALLHPGELGVELGPAGVVVADQDPAVAVHYAQVLDRLSRAGGRRGVPDQPLHQGCGR